MSMYGLARGEQGGAGSPPPSPLPTRMPNRQASEGLDSMVTTTDLKQVSIQHKMDGSTVKTTETTRVDGTKVVTVETTDPDGNRIVETSEFAACVAADAQDQDDYYPEGKSYGNNKDKDYEFDDYNNGNQMTTTTTTNDPNKPPAPAEPENNTFWTTRNKAIALIAVLIIIGMVIAIVVVVTKDNSSSSTTPKQAPPQSSGPTFNELWSPTEGVPVGSQSRGFTVGTPEDCYNECEALGDEVEAGVFVRNPPTGAQNCFCILGASAVRQVGTGSTTCLDPQLQTPGGGQVFSRSAKPAVCTAEEEPYCTRNPTDALCLSLDTTPATTLAPVATSPSPTPIPTAAAPVAGPTQAPTSERVPTIPGTPSSILCLRREDGTIFCGSEDFPRQDHVTLLFGCSATSNGQVNPFECTTCTIVMADSFGDVQNDDEECSLCSTCGDDSIEFDCINLDDSKEDECAAQDCSGNCIANPPTPAPTSERVPTIPGTPSSILCLRREDGTIFCGSEDFPRQDHVTLLFGCSATSNGQVNPFECTTCTIVMADSFGDVQTDDEECSLCSTCGDDSIEFDCINLDDSKEDECAAQDCSGNCIANPSEELRTNVFQSNWYGVVDEDDGCERPTPGIQVKCGSGGVIEILDTTDVASCSYVNDISITCQGLRLPQDEEFWAVVYSCTGSVTSAWTTRVEAIPDTSVSCSSGGAAGTRLYIGQGCTGNGNERDYNQLECDPRSAETTNSLNQTNCLTFDTCGGSTCELSTPDVAAFVPESSIVDECLFDPQ